MHLWPEQVCGQLAPSRLRAKRTNLLGLLCRDIDRAIVAHICLTMQQKFDAHYYGWWSTRPGSTKSNCGSQKSNVMSSPGASSLPLLISRKTHALHSQVQRGAQASEMEILRHQQTHHSRFNCYRPLVCSEVALNHCAQFVNLPRSDWRRPVDGAGHRHGNGQGIQHCVNFA
jgi:hypothetical protein